MQRSDNERLFPLFAEVQGWEMSVQADQAGYQCSPKARFSSVEDYDTVEVMIRSPFEVPPAAPAVETLGHRFEALESTGSVIAHNVPVKDLETIKMALIMGVMRNPNFGVPRGADLWPGQTLYHGASADHAADIVANGVDMTQSTGGYFGVGFYMADDEAVARKNYADFQDEDEAGAVVAAEIAEGAMILDMRNPADQLRWDEGNYRALQHRPDFPYVMRRAGIDGVYDRSFGGVVIYNSRALENMRLGEPTLSPLEI